MVTRAIDINTDPGFSRTTDSNMALSYSAGPDITMALGSSPGYSDLYDPYCRMALEHQHGLGYWPILCFISEGKGILNVRSQAIPIAT